MWIIRSVNIYKKKLNDCIAHYILTMFIALIVYNQFKIILTKHNTNEYYLQYDTCTFHLYNSIYDTFLFEFPLPLTIQFNIPFDEFDYRLMCLRKSHTSLTYRYTIYSTCLFKLF